jgi:hypothetical protein
MGNVIRMDSVPRSALPSSYDEARLEGFKLALKALSALKPCSMRETLSAIENWVASDCGLLTREEADELIRFHGWRRD